MKFSLAFLILMICFSVVASGQEATTADPIAKLLATSTAPTAKLVSTMEVAKQQYCSKSTMHLKVRTTYTNVGSVPILLYKEDKVGYRWVVSQIKGKMKRGFTSKYQPMFELGSLVKWGMEPEEEKFVVLKPGEAISTSVNRPIQIELDGGDSGEGLRPGQYSVRLTDIAWYYPYHRIEPYFKEWREKGVLWWQDITSEPMPFEVAKHPVYEPCSF